MQCREYGSPVANKVIFITNIIKNNNQESDDSEQESSDELESVDCEQEVMMK